MPVPATASIDGGAFDSLVDAVGPFEPAPLIAVGVSGGADSMALAMIADGWARRRGGAAVCLTVDHGLRPESGDEARAVAAWLKRRGIAHHILRWRGEKPEAGVEAAARRARYDLLAGWCRRHSALHLMLAHHLDDQAETVVMRLQRGSGPDGLAAMPAVSELAHLRIVRPLLRLSRERLRRALAAAGQDWIEDPSNQDPAFTRVRIRQAMPVLARQGLKPADIAAASFKLGHARMALERATAGLLADAVDIFPTGYALIRADILRSAPPELGSRVVSAVVTCIGGLEYPPRSERLARLYGALCADKSPRARTLGGCVIAPRGPSIEVAREPAAVAAAIPLPSGMETVWDGRFRIHLSRGKAESLAMLSVGALGDDGWTELARHAPALRRLKLPRAARITLPAIRENGRLLGVPGPLIADSVPFVPGIRSVFSPSYALSRPMFSVV